MKPTQPLALPSTMALIDPAPVLDGGQGPADLPLALGPAPGDAPWFSGLPAPAWQPFQVALKVGAGAPRANGGHSDGRPGGGGGPGRAGNDPRSQPATRPVTPDTVKAAANKPTNGAADPPGGKLQAQQVGDPEIRFIRPDGRSPAQRLAETLKADAGKAADTAAKTTGSTRPTPPGDSRPAAAKPPQADSPKARMDATAADLKAQLQKIGAQAARDAASAYVKLNGTDPANGRFGHDTPTPKLLDGVNDVKGKLNCQPCVVATVLRTMGVDASARNVAGKDLPVSKMEAFFGSKFEPMKLGKIFETMGNAKDGAVAVIHGLRGHGQDGHMFTARNVDGRVRFEDGQTGQRASFDSGYTSFRFMRVK